MSRAVMQQALEALVAAYQGKDKTGQVTEAITALRQTLAEPEQEPVRLQCTTCGTVYADGVPPQVPEQEPQTTHWEGCEAVHPECRKQEPVAWMCPDDPDRTTAFSWPGTDRHSDFTVPLYTAPTLRRPLTHEEIKALDNLPVCPSDAEVITFVRKIERAHGIGEQHE